MIECKNCGEMVNENDYKRIATNGKSYILCWKCSALQTADDLLATFTVERGGNLKIIMTSAGKKFFGEVWKNGRPRDNQGKIKKNWGKSYTIAQRVPKQTRDNQTKRKKKIQV